MLAFAAVSCAGVAEAQTFTGRAEVKGFGYSSRAVESDPWVVGWHTLWLQEEGAIGASGGLRWLAAVRLEAISSAERGPLVLDPADRDFRRTPASARELWLRWKPVAGLDVEAGRFQLGWGKTDGYSPADAFLPRDGSDPWSGERLPIWGVRLRAQEGSLRLEGVASAVLTPWRVPVLSGRSAPIEPGNLGLPVSLVDGEASPPGWGFLALRLQATAGEWDLGAWGRTGVRPAPILVFRTDQARPAPDGTVTVPVDRRWAREEAAGLEVSKVAGSFVLRGEIGALFSPDPLVGDALLWTLGAERAFGDGTLLVTLAANARGTPVDSRLLSDRAAIPALFVVWNRSERWGSWKAVWASGLRHQDGLLQAEGAYDLAHGVTIAAGLDVPYGSRNGPFGARPDTRRAWASARYAW